MTSFPQEMIAPAFRINNPALTTLVHCSEIKNLAYFLKNKRLFDIPSFLRFLHEQKQYEPDTKKLLVAYKEKVISLGIGSVDEKIITDITFVINKLIQNGTSDIPGSWGYTTKKPYWHYRVCPIIPNDGNNPTAKEIISTARWILSGPCYSDEHEEIIALTNTLNNCDAKTRKKVYTEIKNKLPSDRDRPTFEKVKKLISNIIKREQQFTENK